MKTLDNIIHEHLMSLDLDEKTGGSTPMERAIFFRMKDVAIAFTDQQTAALEVENERFRIITSEHISEQDKLIFELQSELTQAKERIEELSVKLTNVKTNRDFLQSELTEEKAAHSKTANTYLHTLEKITALESKCKGLDKLQNGIKEIRQAIIDGGFKESSVIVKCIDELVK